MIMEDFILALGVFSNKTDFIIFDSGKLSTPARVFLKSARYPWYKPTEGMELEPTDLCEAPCKGMDVKSHPCRVA